MKRIISFLLASMFLFVSMPSQAWDILNKFAATQEQTEKESSEQEQEKEGDFDQEAFDENGTVIFPNETEIPVETTPTFLPTQSPEVTPTPELTHSPEPTPTLDIISEEESLQTTLSTELSYVVEGGNVYFNVATGTIIDADAAITSATIPSEIEGVTVTGIGVRAFEDCVSLLTVQIPDTVIAIGREAFENCTNLSNINIPTSWTSVTTGGIAAGNIFKGCTNLKSITVPEGITKLPDYAFYGCESLETIILPNTMTEIGRYAFSDCDELGTIVLPSFLQTIGEYAFSSCDGLTEIIVPDGVKGLGPRAFRNCINLNSIILPEGLETIGIYTFEGCVSLTSVRIPDAVTTIGRSAFEGCTSLSNINIPTSWKTVDTAGMLAGNIFKGCTNLKSITVPEGITKLPDYAFYGCESLETITLPSTVTAIGNNAFHGCTQLKSLYLSDLVASFGSNVFYNCPALTARCEEYSFATIYCIENNIPFEFLNTSFANKDYLLLDREETYYVISTVGTLANGYIPVNLAYGYKGKVEGQISDQKLEICLPSNMMLIEKTLMLDGVELANYELQDNKLYIDLSNINGRLSFSLRPTEDSWVTSYAVMNFKTNGVATKEVVGILHEKLPLITVNADEAVNTADIKLNGVGPASSDITFYIDGTSAGSTRTNKAGSYTATATIAAPKDYKFYTITAEAKDSFGTTIQAETRIQYSPSAPDLKKFTMTYDGEKYNILELGSVRPRVYFSSKKEFLFDVEFENPDQVENVFIVSTRNNVKKRMEAIWNEATNSFRATGFFDDTNHSYVPGTITVEYSQAPGKLSFTEGIDFTSPQYVNGASEPLQTTLAASSASIENFVNDDTQFQGTIKFADINTILDFNITTEVIPSYLDPANIGEHGYEVVKDDYGAQLYLKIAEYGEDKIRGEIIDFGKDKITEFLIEGKYYSQEGAVESYFSFSQAFGYVDQLLTWDNKRISIEEARQTVKSSSLSPEQKTQMMEKLAVAEKANNGVIAAMGMQIVLSAAGIVVPFPANLILPLLSLQNTNYVDDILGQFTFLPASESDGVQFSFWWAIDPSGFVYDSITKERLPGVSTTVYWLSFEEYDENTKPDDSIFGNEWEAGEWNQENPLISDSEGRYAWDVPEGWWRVKYEKSGYQTTWSEWLAVPPPQTEVNIGMTPEEVKVGDVDKDGFINLADALYIAHIIVDPSGNNYDLTAADVNEDGKINQDDIIAICRFLTGLISELSP